MVISGRQQYSALPKTCRQWRFHFPPALRWLASIIFFLMCSKTVEAKNTLAWTGSASADWNTAGNWSPQLVPGSADDVEIGMIAFTHQPVISSAAQCATLTFGSRQTIILTINSGAALSVGGTVTQQHSEDNLVPNTTIAGGGSMSCSAIVVGDATASKVVLVKATELASTLASLSVSGNIFVNSVTSDLLSGGLGHNNGLFSLQGGLLTLSGRISLNNMLPAYLSGTLTTSTPVSKFSIDATPGQTPHLKLLKDTSLKIMDTNWDLADYFNNAGGTGNTAVEYGGGSQLINTRATLGFDITPQPYQNLIFSGTGTKSTESASGDSLAVGGYLHVMQGTLELQTNHASLGVSGDFSNAATTNLSKASFLGANFSNSGQLSTSADTIRFLGTNQALLDTTAGGTVLNHVVLQSATKTVASGAYVIPTGGYWKVADQSTAIGVSPGAQLTFRSDAASPPMMDFSSAPGPPSGLIMTVRTNTLAAPVKLNTRTARLAPSPAGGASLKSSAMASSGKAGNKILSSRTAPVSKAVSSAQAAVAVPSTDQSVQLKLSGAGADGTLIKFKSKANANYMPSEDSYYLGAGNSGVSLASYSADKRRLSVNAWPALTQATTIKLWIGAVKSGPCSLSIAALNNVPATYHIWLTDKLSGGRADLRAGGSYSFTIDKNNQQSYGDRFELLITLN